MAFEESEINMNINIIKDVYIVHGPNTSLCIDIDEKSKNKIIDAIKPFLAPGEVFDSSGAGEGCGGVINIQYPITVDSQTHVFSHLIDEIWGDMESENEEITELINKIISEGIRLLEHKQQRY